MFGALWFLVFIVGLVGYLTANVITFYTLESFRVSFQPGPLRNEEDLFRFPTDIGISFEVDSNGYNFDESEIGQISDNVTSKY